MRISRREMLQMLAGGALGCELLWGTDNVWGQSSSSPQALALLIGLNEVSPRKVRWLVRTTGRLRKRCAVLSYGCREQRLFLSVVART